MANYLHSYLFSAAVYKWEVPGQKRVLDATNGTTYLLNTNSIDGLIDKSLLAIGKSSMYYFDNPFDSRDNSHYMVTDHSAAQVIGHMDDAHTHLMVTVPVFPDGDNTQTAVNTTYKIADVAFATAVFDSSYATESYIWVRDNLGFKVRRERVSLTLTQILALA